MRRFCALLCVGMATCSMAAATTVTVGDSTSPWLGFMNVSNLPAPQGDGAFQFGSGWGVPDLVTTFDDGANTLTLSPNTVNDPDPYWYIGGGGPGQPGNKIMEANLYIEETDVLNGQTVTFEGNILSDTMPIHETVIFIKDFAPDYSSFNVTEIVATPGPFSISLATDPGLGRHVQYGFATTGVNVWETDVAPFGTVVIGTVPEPTSLALLGLAGLVCLRRR